MTIDHHDWGLPEPALTVLVVGQIYHDGLAGAFGAPDHAVTFARFEDLEASLFAAGAPSLVVSSLCQSTFDAADLAARLSLFGYAGRFRVLVDRSLPDPALVAGELQEVAPGLDLALVALPLGPA